MKWKNVARFKFDADKTEWELLCSAESNISHYRSAHHFNNKAAKIIPKIFRNSEIENFRLLRLKVMSFS